MVEKLSPAHQTKTSTLLLELSNSFSGDEPIRIKDILHKLDGRAFGLLLLALAAPNCIPNIPGISTIFGVLLIAPALQMIFGAGQVWLPKRISDVKVAPSTLKSGIEKFVPSIEKVEKWVSPRLEFLTEKPFTILLGIQVLILAGILLLPIPFANMIPGFSVAFLAIGLIQRDGVMVILSTIFFGISLLLAPLGIGAGLAAIHWTVTTIGNFFANII